MRASQPRMQEVNAFGTGEMYAPIRPWWFPFQTIPYSFMIAKIFHIPAKGGDRDRVPNRYH
jgi:hypothetical protein